METWGSGACWQPVIMTLPEIQLFSFLGDDQQMKICSF
jgi:hypothetical protein